MIVFGLVPGFSLAPSAMTVATTSSVLVLEATVPKHSLSLHHVGVSWSEPSSKVVDIEVGVDLPRDCIHTAVSKVALLAAGLESERHEELWP